MNELLINTGMGTSRIIMDKGIEDVGSLLPNKKTVILTDENVYALYHTKFPKNIPVIIIGLGEKNKTMATLDFIFEKMLEFELDRSSFLLAIGGGIVCDIAGFAASIYMRGIQFGFVSTTLLAQVDASIGGKNGVNFKGYKNMIGTFTQPNFVICDANMLKTLPNEEYIAAYAEIIKHAAIGNASLFSFLETNYIKAAEHDIEVIRRVVYDSLVIKSSVVQQDEKESGLRKMLNFGHTLGHAIEKHTGVIHGNAVAIGMVAAARLSVKEGVLKQVDCERLENLISLYKLPTKMEGLDKEAIIEAMKKDKKRERDVIAFVLLNGIGNIQFKNISIEDLKGIVYDLC